MSDDPHDQERFSRRRREKIPGKETWVASPEDVIITKTRWWSRAKRAKDLGDVAGIISVRGDVLDWPYIERWADLHGSREAIELAKAHAHSS